MSTATLDELIEAGLVVLADGPHGPMWRATLAGSRLSTPADPVRDRKSGYQP